jgi:hypothetical protein
MLVRDTLTQQQQDSSGMLHSHGSIVFKATEKQGGEGGSLEEIKERECNKDPQG